MYNWSFTWISGCHICTIQSSLVVTKSGTSEKRALEIPKEAQSAGVPGMCS